MINEFGGIFFTGDNNLANPGSLEHAIEEIQATVYNQVLYPNLFQKAAVICWRIIEGHIFHDGNKRTGMEACRVFLEINGYTMQIDHGVIDMALMIAKGQIDIDTLTNWLESRSYEINK